MERTMSLGVSGSETEPSVVRETLHAQRELLHKLRHELDAEREASSSAASEALSMILRLQGEKAASEMEASQYKRMAEEKMCHAETSLALFEDLIYQKEMEIASLEFQVQAYRCRLLSFGCSDPAVLDNKFPENLILFSEPSGGNPTSERKMKRILSSPPGGMNIGKISLLADKEMADHINTESFEEKKNPEISISLHGDLNEYWEQIQRINDHVRGISESRDSRKENKASLMRRESMSRTLVSQVSNTILRTAKSDISSLVEKMKNLDGLTGRDVIVEESPIPSQNVHDIFEVPCAKESLAVISEERELKSKKMDENNDRYQKMSSNLERRLSKLPRETSFKIEREIDVETEQLTLLKEIREQLNVMQSDMRSMRPELQQNQSGFSCQEDQTLQTVQEAMLHFWI